MTRPPTPQPNPPTSLLAVRSWRQETTDRLARLEAMSDAHIQATSSLSLRVDLLARRVGWWAALGAAVPTVVELLVYLLT